MSKHKKAETYLIQIKRINGDESTDAPDLLSVEEPLEIRIAQTHGDASSRAIAESSRSIAITMRTPGEDDELAIGFLFTEGIISHIDQVVEVQNFGCNLVVVTLAGEVEIEPTQLDRHSFIASSCGVCGKKSIDAVNARRTYNPSSPFPQVDSAIIHSLPDKLRVAQKSFNSTGGIHASGLFDMSGELVLLREDVGRHNALDKLIGACAKNGMLPFENFILLVSGRASFELVQKAAHAGITRFAAVGAPSSLAVELAQNSGVTLMGFVRNNNFNIYTAPNAVPEDVPV